MIMNIRIIFKLKRAPHFIFEKIYNYRRNAASISNNKKASIQHEEAYDELRSMSLSQLDIENYMNEIIYSRLNGLVACAYFDTENMTDIKNPYRVRVMNDIEKYQYRMSLKEWILMHIYSPVLLKAFAFIIFAKNSIKYRLGLNN